MAVETTTAEGATHYNASAWVLSGSDIANAHLDGDDSTDPFALMAGKTSCHTGWLKSAGMLMPMGYLIKKGYVTAVGDDDQVIYSFRGANNFNIQAFRERYGDHEKYQSIALETNYRSNQAILDLANESIKNNPE